MDPSAAQHHDSSLLRWIIGGDHATAQAGVLDSFLPASEDTMTTPLAVFSSLETPTARQKLLDPTQAEDDAAAAVDQLAEAAKLAEAGHVLGAREILNYQRLPAAPAAGTPLHRAAFYFKEALRVALGLTTAAAAAPSSHLLLDKLSAYRAFSEVSPVVQFEHFTCVQAVLDVLGGAGAGACIHVVDLDIGVGEQWASLLQELAQRRPGAALKVTALVSSTEASSGLELQLVHENLSTFAADTGVPFQFAVFNLADSISDPTELLAITGGDAIAVHFPVHLPAVPSVIHLVRRLGAKLVVTVDRSCDRRSDLPFAAHLFQAFQACVFLLESIDAVVGTRASNKMIERLLIQPRIERCVVSKYRAAAVGDSRAPPWRALLASAGFVPVQASSFAEAQADSLLKKVPVRGFRVEKRDGSLVLHWQRGELVSVTAWRC